MLKDIDAASDAAAIALTQLQKIFDTHLYRAAERLVDTGCVFDLRILRSGRVVTGTAGADRQTNPRTAEHRVYIRYRGMDGSKIEGECSCSERSPCIHVAAVSIAAAKSLREPSADNRRNDIGSLPQPAE